MEREDDSDAITGYPIGVDEEIKEDAKVALQQALNEEELHVKEVCGEMVIVNHRGF